MSDAKLQSVLSSLSQVAGQFDALPSDRPSPGSICVKLNANENPFPSPTIIVQSAIAALERHYLYPEDDNVSLREAASNAYGISKDQVMAGNGSSELLGLAGETNASVLEQGHGKTKTQTLPRAIRDALLHHTTGQDLMRNHDTQSKREDARRRVL